MPRRSLNWIEASTSSPLFPYPTEPGNINLLLTPPAPLSIPNVFNEWSAKPTNNAPRHQPSLVPVFLAPRQTTTRRIASLLVPFPSGSRDSTRCCGKTLSAERRGVSLRILSTNLAFIKLIGLPFLRFATWRVSNQFPPLCLCFCKRIVLSPG